MTGFQGSIGWRMVLSEYVDYYIEPERTYHSTRITRTGARSSM